MTYLNKDSLAFLEDLKNNNNREWFNEHKKRYETTVKVPFENFVAALIDGLQPHFESLSISPKDAIFRIYRDVRFSTDKSPYKTKVSAIVSPGGRKNMTAPGLYIECSSDEFRVYSGLYQLDTKQLKNVRTHISYNMDTFNQLISEKNFVDTFGEIRGEKNKRLAPEFLEDAERQPLLYNKSFYYFATFKPEIVTNPNTVKTVTDTFLVAQPVSAFLYEGLEG